MKSVCTLILAFTVTISTFVQVSHAAQRRSVAFNHVTVIDVTGKSPLLDMTVVVSGNRIVAFGKAGRVRVPRNARVIDATGKFLIPGLWDMHIHLSPATELAIPALIANLSLIHISEPTRPY